MRRLVVLILIVIPALEPSRSLVTVSLVTVTVLCCRGVAVLRLY